MVKTMSQTPQAVQSCHDCLKWMIPQLDKFPRARRFSLGDKIEQGLLDVLELLLDATYRKDKQTVLRAANSKLAMVRHVWRLAYELQVIAKKQFEYGAELVVNLGRQIGGWEKQSNSKTNTQARSHTRSEQA